MNDTEKIGKILKTERQKRGYTQQQIANILNLKRESYAMYEIGKNLPTIETIKTLADFYNVSADYLIGRYIKENAL